MNDLDIAVMGERELDMAVVCMRSYKELYDFMYRLLELRPDFKPYIAYSRHAWALSPNAADRIKLERLGFRFSQVAGRFWNISFIG